MDHSASFTRKQKYDEDQMSHSAMMSKHSRKDELSYSGSSGEVSKAHDYKPDHTSSRSQKASILGDMAHSSKVDKKLDRVKGLKPKSNNSIIAKRADQTPFDIKESPEVRIGEIIVEISGDEMGRAAPSLGNHDLKESSYAEQFNSSFRQFNTRETASFQTKGLGSLLAGDHSDNKLPQDDRQQATSQIGSTRENKLSNESENPSSSHADDKIKNVDFSFKQHSVRKEEQIDFTRQAEAVIRLQKILENKKQSSQIQDLINQRIKALDDDSSKSEKGSQAMVVHTAGSKEEAKNISGRNTYASGAESSSPVDSKYLRGSQSEQEFGYRNLRERLSLEGQLYPLHEQLEESEASNIIHTEENKHDI